VYARQGYAEEAVRGLIGWIRGTDAYRIKAATVPENTASVRLLMKLGFHYEGTDTEGDSMYVLEIE
jgi:ribosomal-protein-alanine N-acetyltransferase